MSRLTEYGFFCGAFVLLLAASGCERVTPDSPQPDAQAACEIHLAMVSGVSAPAGGAAPTVSMGTGWATLKGRFVFDGTPRQRLRLTVGKDGKTCAPGGTAPLDELLIVDESTKGIANIAIYLRDASRVHESAQANDDTVVFDQKQCIFLTHVFPLLIGQTLQIKNSDPVSHNTNIGAMSFNQMISIGSSVDFKPTRESAMPVAVSCNVHPWMLAYVVARDNGYMAITAADGSFEIPNLPAGEELEFQVWHEYAEGSGGALVIDGAPAGQIQWQSRGRFKVQIEQDQTLDIGDLAVPGGAFKG